MFIAAWNLQLCNVHACLKQREALGVSLKVIARIEYNAIGVKSIRFFLEIVLSVFGQPTCCSWVAHLPFVYVCAGVKAGRAVKRTTSSLITSRWTKDTTSLSTPLPSTALPSLHEGQHSLLDADSILAQDVPHLRAAAAMEHIKNSASEVVFPTEVKAPGHDEPALPAPPAQHPAAVEPVPALEHSNMPAPTRLQAHPPAREAFAPAQPTATQPAATVEPVHVVEHTKMPAPTPHQAQSHADQAAVPAQPAPSQPAAAVEPAQLISPTRLQAQPAAPAKPAVVCQPTMVQFMPRPTPKANLPDLSSQPALPQATPGSEASMQSHNPVAVKSSIGEMNEDKVVSTGCLGIFSCFNAGHRGKRGVFGRKKR